MRPLLAMLLVSVYGCARNPDGGPADAPWGFDSPGWFPFVDLAGSVPGGPPDECGGNFGDCMLFEMGPGHGNPFPLAREGDPHESDTGVVRDKSGYLRLGPGSASLDNVWVPNSTDYGAGTISKLDQKSLRELARYLTVTCSSLPAGNPSGCDGVSGCCALDDTPRFEARRAQLVEPGHQAVQLAANYPSRTSVDFDGAAWVENRAPGGQASVTKIANDLSNCPDRNKNQQIDTSSDLDGDGLITTDCNGDDLPDDIASVKALPCQNGKSQEFFGLDDECLLFTTNVGRATAVGRALSLGPGVQDFGPADAWAGTFEDARIFRVDGTTGVIKDEADLPQGCVPNGLVLDSSAIGWSPTPGPGPLCWFNAKNVSQVGRVRAPLSGPVTGGAIAIDRDQNVWIAGPGPRVYRYTPDRKKPLYSDGWWTEIVNPGQAAGATGEGVSLSADSRTPNLYFTWLALDAGWIVRLPGSALPVAQMDQVVDGAALPVVELPGHTLTGVGAGRMANVWAVSSVPAAAIRLSVDQQGTVAPVDLHSPPMANTRCPAGSRCLLKDSPNSDPGSEAYSDFLGWSLGHPSQSARYSYVFAGCPDHQMFWHAIHWDADVPLNTTLTVKARTGPTPHPDVNWGTWTPDFQVTPADLINGHPLVPNETADAAFLQVEFDFATMDKKVSPTLKAFQVAYRCFRAL